MGGDALLLCYERKVALTLWLGTQDLAAGTMEDLQ